MAETVARSLIRLIVTVAILAAIYVFAIKPILDTTNDAIDRAFDATGSISDHIRGTLDDAGIGDLNLGDLSSESDARKLLRCIKRAEPNEKRMRACADRWK